MSELLLLEAKCHLQMEKYDDALKLLEERKKDIVDELAYHQLKASTHKSLGNKEKAIDEIE